MHRKTWWAALALAGLIGCRGNEPTNITGATPSPAAAPADDPDDPARPLTDKDLEQIKKLDEADQKLAIDQKNCPISGQHLGGMGKPIKKVVDGRTVFLCCDGCIEDFDKDPKAAVAKLDKK
jgi:hypothetical protein